MANFYFKTFCFASFLAIQLFSATNSYAQKQTARKTNKNVGYLEYLPSGYHKNSENPVIIFLHGTGEKGNGTSEIHKVAYHGPPKLIKKGKWPSNYPFIVISPQLSSKYDQWPTSIVDGIVEYVKSKYKVDEDRIYLTGLSLGGAGTWSYAADYPGKVAAIAPIAGWGPNSKASKMKDVPVWAFHGNADGIVDISGTRNMINALNRCKPKPAVKPKFTVYSRVGHDSWTRTYDRSTGHNIYDWFLSHSKKKGNTNKKPIAHAGQDKELTLPAQSINLKGSGSDTDGSIKSYSWSKRSGPSVKMSSKSKKELALSQMKAGNYEFRLTVKDNDNATAYDDVKVRVQAPSKNTGKNGLAYKYYEGNWNKLPDFKAISPKRSGTVDNVTLEPRKKNDYFAFKFDGYIKISKAGNYTFYTNSDDGSKLFINGRQIVNNDGQHSKMERSGKVKLSAGLHAISITYFEKKGGETLDIKYAGPGLTKRAIPNNALFKSKDNNRSTGHAMLASALEFENNISEPSMTFDIYPNPFVDRLKLDVQLKEPSLLEITLSDLHGRTVYSRSETPGKGLSTLQIDLSSASLEPGIYLMNVNGPTLNFSRKIIKK